MHATKLNVADTNTKSASFVCWSPFQSHSFRIFKKSSHMFCPRTPSQPSVLPLDSYTRFSLIINMCVLQTSCRHRLERKNLRRFHLRFETNVYSIFIRAARLWIFGLESFLPRSTVFVRKISKRSWKCLVVWVDGIFTSLDGGKVYKYPVHKVERDSSKFWFCGVQTV